MPRYLTIAALVGAAWVLVTHDSFLAEGLPALLVLFGAAASYGVWHVRARPWHDWTVIVLLLPGIASAVWIAVGGLVIGVEHSDEARLLLEVGPGVALTGLLCTLVSYHGRHHPDEAR
ncbi:MAG: hypothetical protein ICV71_06320 [Thermoleophilia bacterium]|nr:hypothetical protein [Thermoleophilia bacterium]MDQ3857801.1 hypothetical protein [Actinomycetota bacterium]